MDRRHFVLSLAALGVPAPRLSSQAGSDSSAGQSRGPGAGRVQTLRAALSPPPHVVGQFRDPQAFERAESGQYYVFDRQGHTVYAIDADLSECRPIVRIGHETGRIIEPTAFAVSPNGTFVVADRPSGLERVQVFDSKGGLLGGFTLPGRANESIVFGDLVLSGVGSLAYDGRTLLIGQPETGGVFTQYAPSGGALKTYGLPRPTGFEAQRDIHLALNCGIPLFNPRGGFYFVFQAGRPLFRKYDASGVLVYERHIEGVELDPILMSLPTKWPTRSDRGQTIPLVAPTVRSAACDATGRLWVAFTSTPVIYVYDQSGEKARVVSLRGAGAIPPGHLFFAPNGHLLVTPGCYEFNT